jgi:predicted nucleotidyltransferase
MDIKTRDAALAQFLAALDLALPDGVSVVLYGSAARGDWDATRSDLNLLLVLEDASPPALQQLMPAVRSWHEAGFTAPADLRRALESALRGKLIRLRQAYARFGDAMPTLGGFAMATVSELLVLVRCIAVLKRRDPGTTPLAAISTLADALGTAESALHQVASHRRDPEWSCTPELFTEYLEAVHRLVEIVDQHQPGAA